MKVVYNDKAVGTSYITAAATFRRY